MEIGTVVSLKVKNPLWDRRKAYAFPIEEYHSYTGKVLPSPSWVGVDKICISTGNDRFAFRVIDRDRIKGFEKAREKPEDSVWSIEGAKGKTYIVALSRGSWSCNCTGFGYRRTCSHVVSAKLLKSQGNKKVEKSEEKCCFNSKAAVQSNSREMVPVREKVKNMAKGSKTENAIATMKANADKPMAAVIPLIAEAAGVDERLAKNYYLWAVRKALAPGKVEGGRGRKASAPKAPKAAKAKVKAPVTLSAKLGKSLDDIAKIKAKNLEVMKAVSAKTKKYNQVARPEGPGVADFDADEARAEIEAFTSYQIDELPSFRHPEKLTADEGRALGLAI
jgi:hypothetical protein